MSRILVMTLVLAGCAEQTATSRPRSSEAFPYDHSQDYHAEWPTVQSEAAKRAAAPAPVAPRIKPKRDDCAELEARLSGLKLELAAEHEKREVWKKDHCKPAVHQDTAIGVQSGRQYSYPAGDGSWMVCDGEIGNSTDTIDAIDIRQRMGTLGDTIRNECEAR